MYCKIRTEAIIEITSFHGDKGLKTLPIFPYASYKIKLPLWLSERGTLWSRFSVLFIHFSLTVQTRVTIVTQKIILQQPTLTQEHWLIRDM